MQRYFLCLVLSVLALSTPAQDEPGKDGEGILVHQLANEGFLLVAGESAVLIDAFVAEPYSIYGALEGEALDALHAGTGVFAPVDLALASHVHRDHFQGEPAQRFLAARPDVVLATSPAVIDALWAAEAISLDRIQEDAVRRHYPADGEEEVLEHAGIRVTFLALAHGPSPRDPTGNMGHVVTLGGVTALHVGDAAMLPERFARYRLPERGIDVAFVPYWYFQDRGGREIVEKHFRPAKLVACHVPPRELEQVTRDLARDFPDVIVFQRALESRRFQDVRE